MDFVARELEREETRRFLVVLQWASDVKEGVEAAPPIEAAPGCVIVWREGRA